MRAKNVDEYIAALPETVRPILETVRSTLRKALPEAEEVISYSMPAFRVDAGVIIYFAAWKEHYSLYPATGRLPEVFKDELAPYKVTKGTIRFPLSEKVPVRLVARIAKFRAAEVAERAKARVAAKKQKALAARSARR